MFETAVVRTHAANRRFSWLTFSLAVHTAAIAAVLASSIATVRLPDQAPKQMTSFIPAIAPPPALGTPNPTPSIPGQVRNAFPKCKDCCVEVRQTHLQVRWRRSGIPREDSKEGKGHSERYSDEGQKQGRCGSD